MILVACALSIGFTILLVMLGSAGLGKDVEVVTPDNITETLKLFTTFEKV